MNKPLLWPSDLTEEEIAEFEAIAAESAAQGKLVESEFMARPQDVEQPHDRP